MESCNFFGEIQNTKDGDDVQDNPINGMSLFSIIESAVSAELERVSFEYSKKIHGEFLANIFCNQFYGGGFAPCGFAHCGQDCGKCEQIQKLPHFVKKQDEK